MLLKLIVLKVKECVKQIVQSENVNAEVKFPALWKYNIYCTYIFSQILFINLSKSVLLSTSPLLRSSIRLRCGICSV